ncbi:MAG: hypothetical protein ABJ327_26785, partial [Litoreibacter sp.]
VLNNLVGCIFRCGWLLRHLDLLIDKMNQKSSFVQILKSVQQGLTSDTVGGEMEGNAVAGASIYKGRQWILIKGICDWGMGKEDGSQAIAAERACDLAVRAIVNLLDAEAP